jgi:hypothetical protein
MLRAMATAAEERAKFNLDILPEAAVGSCMMNTHSSVFGFHRKITSFA